MGKPETKWVMRLTDSDEDIGEDELVSAVFLVAIIDDSILTVRNERRWDLPGGHVEIRESRATAVARETREEAGAVLSWTEPFAIVGLRNERELMLFYATSSFDLTSFSPPRLGRAYVPQLIDSMLK